MAWIETGNVSDLRYVLVTELTDLQVVPMLGVGSSIDES